MASNAELQQQVEDLRKQLDEEKAAHAATASETSGLDELRAQIAELREGRTALSTATVGSTDKVEFVERKVLAEGLVVAEDADGKKSRRYERGEIAKIRPENVEYLESVHAIAGENYRDELGYPSVLQQVLAVNKANQNVPTSLVNYGQVAQAEDDYKRSGLDDGGKGSSDTSVPTSQEQAAAQNQ